MTDFNAELERLARAAEAEEEPELAVMLLTVLAARFDPVSYSILGAILYQFAGVRKGALDKQEQDRLARLN